MMKEKILNPKSSESTKPRTRSSKYRNDFDDTLKDEDCQDKRHPRTRNGKRSVGDEEDARSRRSRHGRDENRNVVMAVKERENSRSSGCGDSNFSLRHVKGEEWSRESDASERSRRYKDEDLQGRGTGGEDPRKREHGGEIGSMNGKRDKHAEKEDVKYNQREGSSHRKRERDNSSEQRKIEDGMHDVRHRREGLLGRERGHRQRDHDEWHGHKQSREESLPRRERKDKQSVRRSGRPVEDKTRSNHSQKSDDYRRSGRDVGQDGERLRKMNRIESDSFPQDKVREDAYARGNRGSDDVTRARFKSVNRNDINASHASRLSGRRQNK